MLPILNVILKRASPLIMSTMDMCILLKFAKENGDTVGRKLIVPTTETNSDADFHRLMYTSSISEMGVNADRFWGEASRKRSCSKYARLGM